MFLQHKPTILIIILALILIAGGVWYSRKPAPASPPVVSGNGEQVVEKTEEGLSGGGVDTSNWREINGIRDIRYVIKVPSDFKLFNPYTETYTEVEQTNKILIADEFFLKSKDSIIATTKEARVLFGNEEKTLVEILRERAKNDERIEIVSIGNTEFSKTKNGKYDYSFTTTDNVFALTIMFDNVDEQIIQKVLQSFHWK